MNLPIDKTTRKPKGFGIVMFMMPEHAVRAYTELDGSVLNGRMLHILPGKGKVTPDQLLDDGKLIEFNLDPEKGVLNRIYSVYFYYRESRLQEEERTAEKSYRWVFA